VRSFEVWNAVFSIGVSSGKVEKMHTFAQQNKLSWQPVDSRTHSEA
jgi:hypothetical protein